MNAIGKIIPISLLAVVACSGEQGLEDTRHTENSEAAARSDLSAEAVDGAEERGTGREEPAVAPESEIFSGAREDMNATGLRISGDAELLTNIVYEDGSEVAFIRIGEGFLISELIDADVPSRVKPHWRGLNPVERFQRLAPELAVPTLLSETQERLQWNVVAMTSEHAEFPADPDSWQRPGDEPELDQPVPSGPALDGLQAFNGCDTGEFMAGPCDFGDDHDHFWRRRDRATTSDKTRSNVWEGESHVCTKTGQVSVNLRVSGTNIDIDRDLPAPQVDHRFWETLDCDTSCSLWDCNTFCFPDGRTVTNVVNDVNGSDRFHHCGFYNFE